MVRIGLSLCCLAALLWAAPVRGQGGEEAEEGEAGEAAEMSTGTTLRPRSVPLPAGTDADDPLSPDEDGDGDIVTTESETETAGGGTQPSADELAEAGEDDAERPFFGVSLGGKGTVGGNLWTAPEHSPSYALMFDGTAGGWGGGGGLYTELRVLWGYLGLEVDVLFERNSSWHNVTWNKVLGIDWVLKWTSLRVPILVKGIIPTSPVRISLGLGPEIVAGLGAETELVVTKGEDLVPAADIDRLRQAFITKAQTDTYFTLDLGFAAELWQLAVTFDIRAGFNLTQPTDYDDLITYVMDGDDLIRLEIIASNSMDFRALLGVAWDPGFGF